MVSFAETTTRLERVPPHLPPPNPDVNAIQRIAAKLGVHGVDRVVDASYGGKERVCLELFSSSNSVATFELRPGAPLVLCGRPRIIKKANVWLRVDTALFGEGGGHEDHCAAWLHRPYPPPMGEMPSLLLEAFARIAGLAAGIDGLIDDAPLRLNDGTASPDAVSATIAQKCICAYVRRDHHGGAPLGATLEICKDHDDELQLTARCQHVESCNTLLCSHALSPSAHESLKLLFAAAVEHSAPGALPELAAAMRAANAKGRALLDTLESLVRPSPEAIARVRSGSWQAWRSSRPHSKGTLVGRQGTKRPPTVLPEDHV